MDSLRNSVLKALKWLERYTKTDMVYLAKGGFWLNSNTLIVTIFSLLLSISFAKFVSKDTYGIYQFLISIASILGGLTLTGMNNAVTQSVARGFEGVLKQSIKTQIKFGLISFLAGLVCSIYYFINGNNVIAISLVIISLTLPIINALNTWSAFISGKKDFKNLFIYAQIVNFTYYTGLIITIILMPDTLSLIFAGFLLNTLSNLLVYLLVLKKYNPNNLNENKTISYGKKLSLSNILPTIGLHIDNIIVFHFLGPVQLAIYAFASNIPERLGGFIKPISNVAFPKLSVKSEAEVSEILPQKIYKLFAFSSVAGVIYIFAAPFIFNIFFPEYISSVIYSQVYAVAIILSITASLPTTSLYATRSNHIYTLNVVHPLFSITSIFLGTYYFGLWGVIFSKIASNAFLLLYSYSLIRRKE